jgi:hypothetical protein
MNISLPDSLKSFVDEQVTQRGYGTSSEYVRELFAKMQMSCACVACCSKAQPLLRLIRLMPVTFRHCVSACKNALGDDDQARRPAQ